MRKQELYDFIENKLYTKRQEVLKKKSELASQIKAEIEKEVVGLNDLGAAFSRLTDVMEKAKADHTESTDYSLQRKIRNVHDCIPFKRDLVGQIFYNTALVYLEKERNQELQILEKKIS